MLEEPDFSASRAVSGKPEEVESFDRVCKAIDALFRGKSLDPAFGLRLPPLFQESGLSELTVENDAPLSRGGSEMARMMRMSTEQLRAEYIATGCADKDDIDRYDRFVEDPASWAIYYATVAASGRKKPRNPGISDSMTKKKKLKRVTRPGRISAGQAAKEREIRRKIQDEFPPVVLLSR